MTVRTRIAPSPTGMLHIGTARTALFNYLFAKKHKGEFLLRIEDTDEARNTKESYDAIFAGLNWLGLEYNGDVVYQSKRYDMHRKKLEYLIEKGLAYYSFISDEEISKRKEHEQSKNARYIHRYSKEDDVKTEERPVVRLKVSSSVDITIQDKVQGSVVINSDTIEDFILLRSDGTPVYMFAVVCDDIDMQITHVIRGVDHLTNTAKQILLYNAFGVQMPVFAHIPLIHGEDGAKLSKRHGAVSTMEYKNQGYLPEAMRAYLLRLGWGTSTDEILNDFQAISMFSLEGIGKSPACFDENKLKSVNEFFIKNYQSQKLLEILTKEYSFDENLFINPIVAVDILKTRSKTLIELLNGMEFFKKSYTPSIPVEKSKVVLLQGFFQNTPNQNLQEEFKVFLDSQNIKFKDIGSFLREILISHSSFLGIFDIITVISFEEAKKRVLNFSLLK